MKKEFLDYLYDQRAHIISREEEIKIAVNMPRAQCCDNMESDSEIDGRRAEINSSTNRNQSSNIEILRSSHNKLI